MLPLPILSVIENLQKLPGVGRRGAQKLALDILESNEDHYNRLILSVQDMREKIHFCSNCGFFADQHICAVCQDKYRDTNKIVLVEKATDILNIEKTQIYNGQYHVLRQLISPIDNIFADATTLPDLLNRRLPDLLERKKTDQPIELITFLKNGFNADTTIAYLKDYIRDNNWQEQIVISKLAEGLPLYYNPDNLDQATMIRALEDRRQMAL